MKCSASSATYHQLTLFVRLWHSIVWCNVICISMGHTVPEICFAAFCWAWWLSRFNQIGLSVGSVNVELNELHSHWAIKLTLIGFGSRSENDVTSSTAYRVSYFIRCGWHSATLGNLILDQHVFLLAHGQPYNTNARIIWKKERDAVLNVMLCVQCTISHTYLLLYVFFLKRKSLEVNFELLWEVYRHWASMYLNSLINFNGSGRAICQRMTIVWEWGSHVPMIKTNRWSLCPTIHTSYINIYIYIYIYIYAYYAVKKSL